MQNKKRPLRLNLGCGLSLLTGYMNIDNSPNVILSRFPLIKKIMLRIGIIEKSHMVQFPKEIVHLSIPAGLRRFKSGSVDRIYTSHFLEHLTEDNAFRTLRECGRLLEKGGIFRIVLPDTVNRIKSYITTVEEEIRKSRISTLARDKLVMDLFGGLAYHKRSGHRSMWDLPSICYALKSVGFNDVRICSFRQGEDIQMVQCDNRPNDSIFVEAIK